MQGQKPASYGALWPGYAENHFHFHDELLQHRTSWWSEGWACRTSRSRRDAVATKVILDLSEVFQAGVQLGCLAEAQPRPPMTCCRLLWTKRFFLGATAHPLCCCFVCFFHKMRQSRSGKDRPGSYAGHVEGASGGVQRRTRRWGTAGAWTRSKRLKELPIQAEKQHRGVKNTQQNQDCRVTASGTRE